MNFKHAANHNEFLRSIFKDQLINVNLQFKKKFIKCN